MNEYIIIVFGASGDLVKKKLLPALYGLMSRSNIANYCIVGAAYDDINAQDILERTKPFVSDIEQDSWRYFSERFFYLRIDFGNEQDFYILKEYVLACANGHNIVNAHKLIYFAVASPFFANITSFIAMSGIAQRSDNGSSCWTRLVYEKPFGRDVATARQINSVIATYFNEDQIYRIDHYLTKELVGNIALVRFTNLIFEPLWSNRYIDNVQIILSEKDNIGNRGQYYDQFGAISDVMQNHMLELLALIGMEAPKELSGNYVRDQRAKVLACIKVVDLFLGQYETYKNEPFVHKSSQTETFAAAVLRIENRRWSGVPFYLKTGKCLDKKETMIHVKFKLVDCLLASCPIAANVLTIEISPNASFTLRLNAKKPGESHEVVPVTMEFCHSCLFGYREEQAYETLLAGVLKGEESVSVRFDEIESAWSIIDVLKNMKKEVYSYACGSTGPKEIASFNKKHGIRWLS